VLINILIDKSKNNNIDETKTKSFINEQ